MSNIETISKESDATGVFFRRVVHDANGVLVTDERVKLDPVLTFSQPPTLHLGDTASVAVTLTFHLYDYDGEHRADSGAVSFRLQDREAPREEAVVIERPLVGGVVALTLAFETAGHYVIVLEPPLVADMQLAEPVTIRIE